MKTHSKFLGLGLAAVMAAGLLAAPAAASAQSYRYRNSTHSADGARNNAIALGAAGLLLLGNHQQTLGTIALGAAALEGIQMQNDLDNRYGQYGYAYGRNYGDGDHDRDDSVRVDRNRDRDDRGNFWSSGVSSDRGGSRGSARDSGHKDRSGRN